MGIVAGTAHFGLVRKSFRRSFLSMPRFTVNRSGYIGSRPTAFQGLIVSWLSQFQEQYQFRLSVN
jgi:hypothetical protein